MITAQEFLIKQRIDKDSSHSLECNTLRYWMVAFAKLHVEEALKQASEQYLYAETHESDSPPYLADVILNAYPLELIK